MPPFQPTIDAVFREYAKWELRCHYLLLDGKENAPETVAAEGRMEQLWEKLDEVQRRSLSGMGSDLNWVRRKGEPPPKGRKSPEEVAEIDQKELVAAIGAKDWHRTLHYLRLCAPMFPIATLADLRGRVYDAIGLPAYASVFHEQAAELNPANSEIGVVALGSLKKTNPERAAQRAERIIASPLHYPPAVLALSAVMILQRDETQSRPIDRQQFSTLLNDAAKRLQLEPSEAAREMAYQAAATGFWIIGDLPAALRCFDEGLKQSPNNDLLLVGKAQLQYGSQTDQAVETFLRLTQAGTSSKLPYFYLAHHYLLRGNYGASLEMGREAWTRTTADPFRAQLLEWQAICLAELHFPSEIVRPYFVEALSLDPSNPHIANNLAVFDSAMGKSKKSIWHVEEASQLNAQRVDSMREPDLAGIP